MLFPLTGVGCSGIPMYPRLLMSLTTGHDSNLRCYISSSMIRSPRTQVESGHFTDGILRARFTFALGGAFARQIGANLIREEEGVS